MTQKDLAEKLIVTPQAVSRWESDDVEPSVGALKQMATIFNVSMDELLSQDPLPEEAKPEPQIIEVEKPVVVEKPVYVEKPVVVEKQVVVEKEIVKKAILGICSVCKKEITNHEDLIKISSSHGRGAGRVTTEKIFCKSCHDRRMKRIQHEKEEQGIHNRKLSIVFGILAFLVVFGFNAAVAVNMTDSQSRTLYWVLAPVLGILFFTMISCFLLKNNPLFEIWAGVSSWSIHFPGIIFTFDLDGLKFLILMKLLFFVLGVLFSIAVFLLATGIALFLSLFFYPFALARNIKHPDEFDD